ncbi:nucleotidyl transferase AbiEii/AbiGii toxin family protein [Actinoplanes sp. G11-F43]|uniref:nucleotidyl transferase AbiEii/AbiGii toxin family protein n=1 Tax=Actinoplanes sp. G11-F43 TaxID=3424130 RepID=UPI003D3528B5
MEAARLDAIYSMLKRIAASPWADRLVLCGSVALRAQLGGAARMPADIDLIAVPYLPELWDRSTAELRDGLIGLADDPSRVQDRHLWEYNDAPGLRLGFPFGTEAEPDLWVMVDVVLGEDMPLPPETLEIMPGVRMLAVPPALALASKLRWLESEENPKAKDLYDAVLLAEHTTVDPVVVRSLLRRDIGAAADGFGPRSAERWTVDWDGLIRTHPTLAGDVESWRERLIKGLWRSFSDGT